MGPLVVVESSPLFEGGLRFLHVRERVLVEALVAKPGVEALDECVLRGFARFDEVKLDVSVVGPALHRAARELGAIVPQPGAMRRATSSE